MSTLISLNNVYKRHGAQSLFSGLTLSITENDRLGIVGPNGSGKSTLLRILAGVEEIDSGRQVRRRDLRVAYAAQNPELDDDATALEFTRRSAAAAGAEGNEIDRLARTALSQLAVEAVAEPLRNLSGGLRKRVQLAATICRSPDLLLLDEPTNHLDIESIVELEQVLSRAPFAWVVVSHDRWFLENAVTSIAELNQRFPDGLFLCGDSYRGFIERRAEFLRGEESRRESLANKVRTETAWLRQGAKARSTKSRHRTEKAHEMMEALAMVRARERVKSAEIAFDATNRQTKKLIEARNLSKSYDGKKVIGNLSIDITAGSSLGLLGRNGSGKSTVLQLLAGELEPDSGSIERAPNLRLACFRQIETGIEPGTLLKRVLAEQGDSVVFRGESHHVAGWARRFNFRAELLEQPFGSLSGGEQARARLARLMLEPADVLVLDEPTNDLDIETLEVLEHSLLGFEGALILVSHDRFMLNRICNSFLALDGAGNAATFASYEQWQSALAAAASEPPSPRPAAAAPERSRERAKRLSYNEQREYDRIEQSIAEAEEEASRIEGQIAQASGAKLQQLCSELSDAQARVEQLYRRWEELEQKLVDFSQSSQ